MVYVDEPVCTHCKLCIPACPVFALDIVKNYIGVVELIIKDGNVVEQSGRIDTMKLAMPDDQRIMQMIEEYEQRSGRINHQKSKLKNTIY